MSQDGETSENTPLRILITDGVSGVGRSLVRQAAARGHNVTAITRTNQGANIIRELGCLPAYADLTRAGEIRSALKMAKTDVLIHNAPVTVLETPFDPHYAGNLLKTTEAIVQAVKETETKFLVHTSYALLYGDTHDEMTDESAHLEAFGGDLVTDAKRADMLVNRREVPACVLRCGYVYGPYSETVSIVAEKLRSGRGLPVGAGKNYANWVHEDDLALAYVLAAEQQPAGQVFNIVDDRPVPPADFLKEFGGLIGLNTADAILDRLARAFSSNRTAAEVMKFSVKASNAKAKAQLGWQPKYADRTEGLEHTLRTWRADVKIGS